MENPIKHLCKQSPKANTACGRIVGVRLLRSFEELEEVNCKKCLGYERMRERNTPKRHLMVQKGGRDFLHYNTACHTVGGKETHFIEAVTCKKCLYIISKSLKLGI